MTAGLGRVATRWRLLIIAVISALAISSLAASPTGTRAYAAPQDAVATASDPAVFAATAGLPDTVGADALPTWQINGVVWSQAIVGTTVYVTGKFTRARPPGVARGGPGEVDAANLFAFDLRTGAMVTSFRHALNAQGMVVRASPDGSRIYVGGDFTTVDGVARSHLAAFDTATNALVDDFQPAVAGQVRALAISRDTVYVGGNFSAAGGLTGIRSLASFAVADGADRNWHPIVGGVSPVVFGMALAPGGDAMVLGGGFDQLDSVTATGMGKVGLDGTVRPWAASERIKTSGLRGAITSITTDGRSIFGTGMSYSDPAARFEGTFSADPADGSIRWINDCLGDSYDTAPMAGVVYAVHHNHDCRTIGEFGDTVPRTRWMKATAIPDRPGKVITELDEYTWDFRGLNGAGLLQWYPDLAFGTATSSGQAAWTVGAADGYVVLGGEFPKVNGVAQEGLTRFAVRDIGPHRSGPVVGPDGAPVTQTLPTGVEVSWPAAADADDADLNYTLLRDGTAVGTVRAASAFWHRPGLSLLDPGGRAGARYTVRVSDGDGNTATTDESEPAGPARPDTTYGAAVLADGAAHYWSLDGGGGTFPDRVGGDTLAGAVGTVDLGVAGAAIGTTADAELTARATDRTTPATSVEAWVRTSATGGGRIVGRGSDPEATSGYRNDTVLYLDASGRPAFATTPDKPKATSALTGPAGVADGRWHHLVGTVGNGVTALWVDGVRVAQAATANQAQFAGYWRMLGDSTAFLPNAPATPSVVGAVDEVAVYPGVLSEQVIQRHHALGLGGAVDPGDPDEPGPGDGTVRDSFSRTADAGWGTADTGQAWTVSGRKAAWSVGGGAGRYSAGAGNGTAAVLGGTTAVDTDVAVTLGADKAPTGGGQFSTVSGRFLDVGNSYAAKLKLTAAGTVVGYLVRKVGGTSTDLATATLPGLTADPDSPLRIRVQVAGTSPTTIRMKVWPAGGDEPTVWALTATDDEPELQQPGSVALQPYLAASATNAPVVFSADDLVIAGSGDGTDDAAVAQDGFARVETSGWGRADVGGTWATTGTATVGDGAGALRVAAGRQATASLPVDLADSETRLTMSTDTAPTGSGQYLSVLSRAGDGSSYRTKVRLTSSGAVQVYLCRTVDGVETILASTTLPDVSYRPGTALAVRMQTIGTGPATLRASVWPADQAAPPTWTLTATDDAPGAPGSGGFGVVGYVSASAGSAATFRIDDVWVGAPQ